ncbi:MAG: GNAT family N-acetyltransferase [Arenimonas sp.]
MHDPITHAPLAATKATEWLSADQAHRLPTLEGLRLRLRWLDHGDLDSLFGVFSDRDALRWWRHPPFASADDASIYLEQIHRGHEHGDLLQWGVERLADGEMLGTALLANVDAVHGRAELRLLLKSRHWGQGYGRESATVLLTHAFGDLGLRRIEAETPPANTASLKALEALGFKREGYLRQRWLVRDQSQDSVMLGLLAGDFCPAT